MKIPVLLAAALSAAFSVASGSPIAGTERKLPDQAEVTLPLGEVLTLLESARPAENAPPVKALVTAALLRFDLGKPAAAIVEATFEVESLAPGWQLVPLVGFLFPVTHVAPADATLVMRDGLLAFLARKPGRQRLILTFEVPESFLEPGEFPFRVGPVTAGRWTIETAPASRRATLRSREFPSPGSTGPLPAAGGEMTLQIAENKPAVPTPWQADLQTLLIFRNDRVLAESRIRLTGDSGSGLGATLALPPDALGVTVTGPDLVSATSAERSRRVLSWDTPDRLSRDVIVQYELPLPSVAEPWTVRPPEIVDGSPRNVRTVIVGPTGFKVAAVDDNVATTEILPDWMEDRRDGAPPLVVRSTEAFPVTFAPRPRLEVDTARIPEARYATRVVADGSRLTEARLQIRHRGALRWRFTPPKGSELLTCEILGNGTNPLLLASNELELSLPSSGAALTTTEVTFSYLERGTAFAPVEGKLSLGLPSSPTFTEALEWTLLLPDGYEATAFEGNVEPHPGGAEIKFMKRLIRNEAASVEIYYRKRDSQR